MSKDLEAQITKKIPSYTPREVVGELDRYIVSQDDAKRSVAIALRNRWRRRQVPEPLRDEISPKNIIMMGPTGSGKTEIARRLAKLAQAPFVKVEATKYTEVGYVGRDVESMVRELAAVSIKMVKEEAAAEVKIQARQAAEERLLDLLLPESKSKDISSFAGPLSMGAEQAAEVKDDSTREKLRQMFLDGKLDAREVEMDIKAQQGPQMMHMFGQPGMEDMASQIQDALSGALGGGKKKRQKLKVADAFEHLEKEEADKLLDMEQIHKEAILRAEQSGIIFIDEIDKVASGGKNQSRDVSREGVQRDILPIVEGSAVQTKFGTLKTDHVLFIAAGAFHMSKPQDLIPELQGRFPIRVKLLPLTEEDFVRILKEPENSLMKQYIALLKTEKVTLDFTDEGLNEIAKIAAEVNRSQENIGARRLHTVLEKLLEEISFEASERADTTYVIDAKFVAERLEPILEREDLSKYVL